ncbi:DUF4429 domain-containing protein [Streptomyces cahuitamycinicus]|uniref:SHOCT domain-containing protein n=1 Tax=Streptomyces cahuitamycinicus TaxID=2070367 RepID=A0A2N8TEP4_9ACTN|nr:DUF4429 domain-containing protein [Streptomyces cahuitamycinicus]PNG17493.1 hypothetical protein C1J00_36270 [Streptomyces cahuitamycinicus]
MIQAKGQGGQIAFDGQYVTITREGFLGRATHGRGEKKLHITSISAVQWKPPGMMTNGFIQLSIGGADRQAAKGSRTLDATKDENSVIFTKKQAPDFEKLRAALEQAIAAQHAPQAPAAAAPTSLADELGKLVQLRDQGVLSPEEFEEQKARLLGQ